MIVSENQPSSWHQPERRVAHRVRAVFTEACALIAPLRADPAATISGFGMAQLPRNRYPEPTDAEIHALTSAATNYLQDRT